MFNKNKTYILSHFLSSAQGTAAVREQGTNAAQLEQPVN